MLAINKVKKRKSKITPILIFHYDCLVNVTDRLRKTGSHDSRGMESFFFNIRCCCLPENCPPQAHMPGWGELGEVVERFGLVSIRYFVRVLSQVTNIDITMLFHCLTHNTHIHRMGVWCVCSLFHLALSPTMQPRQALTCSLSTSASKGWDYKPVSVCPVTMGFLLFVLKAFTTGR